MYRFAAAILMAGMLLSAPEGAAAQQACDVYRVKRGDTLREINMRAFGNDNYRTLYRENRTEIGRNPNIIEIGMVLRIPCPDGQALAQAMPQSATADRISFVTANGYLPYTDESLPHSGLVTHLVSQSMLRANPSRRLDIVFVNDWSAHLEALLPRQAFDASFPWTAPGCETQGVLTQVEMYACQNYAYSDPLYEIVDGYFTRAGDGLERVSKASGFEGLRLCRPEGYPTGHLEEAGLMPPDVRLIQPTTAYACFQQLMAGAVDVVSLDTRAAARVLDDLGLTHQVNENPYVFSIRPLRVAFHTGNPKTEALVADLNRGLRILLETGEWTSIVQNGLKAAEPDLLN